MIDIMALATEARRAGTDTPERVVAHLQEIIARNVAYTERRLARQRTSSFDTQLRKDNQVLAQAIIYINNLDSLVEGNNE